MKVVQIGIFGLGGMVLFLIGAGNLLGISDAANTEQKKAVPQANNSPVFGKPTGERAALVTSFKKPVKKDTKSDGVISTVTDEKHSENGKNQRLESSVKHGETERKSSHILNRIDSVTLWPKLRQ